MNLSVILKLFGLDVKKPLDMLLKVMLLVDDKKLTEDIQKGLCLNMTSKRKADLSGFLKDASTALDNGDCSTFASVFLKILKGIRL